MFELVLPNRYRLVAGRGDGSTELNAVDRALTAAGVGDFNLVKVSSILPPGAAQGSLDALLPGAVVFSAMGALTSHRAEEMIAAAVAVGIPADRSCAGVLMEGGFRSTGSEAEERVREMARTALSDRGIDDFQLESLAIETTVRNCSAVIAAVLLWRE